MNLARVFAKTKPMQQDREPAGTYEQAVARLVQRQLQGVSPDAVSEMVMLVADIFWATDLQVRRDMTKILREIGGH